MAENPDVTGDFAAFNTLSLKGTPITPGGGAIPFCTVQSLTQNVSDDTPLNVNSFTPVVNTDAATFTPQTNGVAFNVGGIYLIVATVNFNAGDGTSIRRIALIQNGIIRLQQVSQQQLPGATTPTQVQVIWIGQFPLAGNFQIELYQNSGSIVSTNGIFLQVLKIA